ncbi:MFS transporter [Streptomyces sp. NPDC048603]|uniref:MFS transporter n=1 Tax=Streptomyces sp. NPDC048603 TaxID=3365577 RepID=UPI003714200B
MTEDKTGAVRRGGRRAVLRDRNARLYLGAVLVSGFGTSAFWLAAGVWVKTLTGSDGLAALTFLAMWLATPFGPLLGTIADRVRRKPLLIGVNLGLAVLLLSLLAVDSANDLWILFAVLVAYGVGGVVQDAAEAALIAVAVDRALLADFNGLRMAANEGMKLVAPLAGAALCVRFGGQWVAVLDAVSFLLAAWILTRLPVTEKAPVRDPGTDGGGRWAETAAGVRALWDRPHLRALTLAAGAVMAGAGLGSSFLYALVDDGLNHSPAFLGVLYTAQGIGSIAAGLLAGTLMRRCPPHTYAAAGITLFGTAVALRALPYDATALACSVVIGAGLPCVIIAALTAVQQDVPTELVGRAAAGANALLYAPNALALAIGPALVPVVDHRLALPLIGAAVVAVGAALATARAGRGGSL